MEMLKNEYLQFNCVSYSESYNFKLKSVLNGIITDLN